ncbi:MAG: hypothetical protein V3V08_23625 [Nannocystaceae bacterium]
MANDPASPQTLSDVDIDLLAVLALIGEPVSRSEWRKQVGVAGLRKAA